MPCPPEWVDKSMLVLSAERPGNTGVTPNMVVARDRMPEGAPPDPMERIKYVADR